ncbi:MAG: Uma2 family endonuclease [Rhodothermales bacterium]
MAQPALSDITPAEYFALDNASERKWEYVYGRLYAMAGASPRHSQIVSNLVRALGNKLAEKPCHIFPNDIRTRLGKGEAYGYPDVVVVYGKPEFSGDRPGTLENPNVIIEVLSDSTKEYDRGTKASQYIQIESLGAYLTIDPVSKAIERRQRKGGRLYELGYLMDEPIDIECLAITLTPKEIFRGVDDLPY